MINWKSIRKVKEHSTVKNKNLKTIYINESNVEEVQKETRCFEIFSNSTLLTGFMSFQKFPVYIIWINPRSSRTPMYYFADDVEFERHFEFIEEDNDND